MDDLGLGNGHGQAANEGFRAGGDSGAPVFIDGRIAGVHKARSGLGLDAIQENQTADFGEVNKYVRVSSYQDFINNILDNPFDLVLNMENQPWGNDELDDTIVFTSNGGHLEILIDGESRYSESIGKILSITVHGSDDKTRTAQPVDAMQHSVSCP